MAKKENVKKRHFFKDFKAELKKVIWPTPKQLFNNTIAVIVIVLITAAIVFVLDLCFDFINSKGVNSLKAKIRNKVVVENVVDGENTENSEDTVENSEEASSGEEEQAETATNAE